MVVSKKNEFTVIVATLALLLYTLTLGVIGQVTSSLQPSKTISNAGQVKAVGVGVYWDQSCTSEVSSINWGIIEPGSNENATVYIRNEGNTVATLNMATSNWNPSNASTYMTLSWDYGGQSLNVGEVVQVKFTLSVSSSIAGIQNFSFDITITANG